MLFRSTLSAEAVADRVTGDPTSNAVPLVGAVSVTTGAEVETVTLTDAEVTTAPLESVTRAVRDWVPVPAGVQEAVYTPPAPADPVPMNADPT